MESDTYRRFTLCTKCFALCSELSLIDRNMCCLGLQPLNKMLMLQDLSNPLFCKQTRYALLISPFLHPHSTRAHFLAASGPETSSFSSPSHHKILCTFLQMPEDAVTVPGFGIGLYAAGYKTLVRSFALLARAAEACMSQRWNLAADILQPAVQLEFSMGYIEPPRFTMSMRPCFAVLLLLAGENNASRKVIADDHDQYPNNWWGLQAAAAVAAAETRVDDLEIQRMAMAACRLLFG
jgi:hypothetical protein